jgi:hypothetical protein
MLPEKAVEPPAIPPGYHSGDAAHALFAATAQMGLALHESQEPVAELGSLCAQFSESLAALRSASGAPVVTDPQLLARLQADVFKGIQQLQFYDRMVQHLTHIQAYLIAVANELGAVKTDAPAPGVWDDMHARLRKRLISDEQRGLLDLFLSPHTTTHVSAQAPRVDYSPPGSFEMFE